MATRIGINLTLYLSKRRLNSILRAAWGMGEYTYIHITYYILLITYYSIVVSIVAAGADIETSIVC